MVEGSEPRYVISIAARMLGVHTHTLRYYERVGLLEPARSESNLRLYSDQDIERLRRIRTLMDELGVNLAGVEVIFKLLARMEVMQQQIENLRREISG
ncbi:MAG TPA: MerR family transcriptional regulator [Dehalococcoidia bacterium]|nr:MerR family transcriptional regulator [Dehalococcoidia bacterium]